MEPNGRYGGRLVTSLCAAATASGSEAHDSLDLTDPHPHVDPDQQPQFRTASGMELGGSRRRRRLSRKDGPDQFDQRREVVADSLVDEHEIHAVVLVDDPVSHSD